MCVCEGGDWKSRISYGRVTFSSSNVRDAGKSSIEQQGGNSLCPLGKIPRAHSVKIPVLWLWF